MLSHLKRMVPIAETFEPGFEQWRDVAGYEGLYQVSSHGRLRSLKYHMRPGRVVVLKQFADKGGYLRAKFCKDGNETTVKVHRVVAEAFLPNPDRKREVNHKDGNTMNNVPSNLEWATPSENMKHASASKLVKPPVVKAVLQLTTSGELVRKWESARRAAISLGFDPSAITKCCKGKLQTTGGFAWRYEIEG